MKRPKNIGFLLMRILEVAFACITGVLAGHFVAIVLHAAYTIFIQRHFPFINLP